MGESWTSCDPINSFPFSKAALVLGLQAWWQTPIILAVLEAHAGWPQVLVCLDHGLNSRQLGNSVRACFIKKSTKVNSRDTRQSVEKSTCLRCMRPWVPTKHQKPNHNNKNNKTQKVKQTNQSSQRETKSPTSPRSTVFLNSPNRP